MQSERMHPRSQVIGQNFINELMALNPVQTDKVIRNTGDLEMRFCIARPRVLIALVHQF